MSAPAEDEAARKLQLKREIEALDRELEYRRLARKDLENALKGISAAFTEVRQVVEDGSRAKTSKEKDEDQKAKNRIRRKALEALVNSYAALVREQTRRRRDAESDLINKRRELFDVRNEQGRSVSDQNTAVAAKSAVSSTPLSASRTAPSAVSSANGVGHEGFLSRKSEDGDLWENEYFVVGDDHQCRIYKTKEAADGADGDPRSTIDLVGATVLPYVARYGVGQHTLFVLRTSDGDHLLQAASATDKGLWVSSFKSACIPQAEHAKSGSARTPTGTSTSARTRRYSNSWSFGLDAEDARQSRHVDALLRGASGRALNTSASSDGPVVPRSSDTNGTQESPRPDTYAYESSDEDEDELVLHRRIG